MNLVSLTEIRGDSFNSGHRWSEKRKLSTWMGASKKKLPMRFADIPDGNREDLHYQASESCICHTNLGTTIKKLYVSYLDVATDACNSDLNSFSTFVLLCFA